MAGVDYTTYNTHGTPLADQQGLVARFMNFVGAVSSVALVVGLGYWGYELSVRDVSEVPVVRALQGEARVKPTEPGGQLPVPMGLAVNGLQADGKTAGPAPEVVLAPDPIDVTEQDAPAAAPPDPVTPTVVSFAPSSETGAPEDLDDTTKAALALAEKLAAGVAPLEPLEPLAEEAPEQVAALAILPRSVPGVRISPRPDARPRLNPAAYRVTAINAALKQAIEVDPTTIAPGARLVQLGAFDSREDALSEWQTVSTRFAEFVEDKSLVITEAVSGGRRFFRLRAAGFETLDASRRFCAVLTAEGALCIPVRAD